MTDTHIGERIAAAMENEAERCERLQKQLDALIVEYDHAKQKSLADTSQLAYLRGNLLGLARTLAEAGSYDHKTKNEAILRVIGLLISYAVWQPAARDMENLPF